MIKPTVFEVTLDTSAWLAYLLFESELDEYIDYQEGLFTSALTIYEIKRKLSKDYSIKEVARALEFIKMRSLIIEVTADIAEIAAAIALSHNLAAVDSIIYATSHVHRAKLVTLDNDFRGLENVQILTNL